MDGVLRNKQNIKSNADFSGKEYDRPEQEYKESNDQICRSAQGEISTEREWFWVSKKKD